MFNLKNFFNGAGKIVNFKNTCVYRIDKLTDIWSIVIPHFDKYTLVTQKYADYILFKEIVTLVNNKEHLTLEGIKKILAYKASLNLGFGAARTEDFKEKFSDIKAVGRPIINKDIPSPLWVTGFVNGDGSFYLTIRSYKSNNIPRRRAAQT